MKTKVNIEWVVAVDKLVKAADAYNERVNKFIDRRFIDDGPDREYNKVVDEEDVLLKALAEVKERPTWEDVNDES